MNMTTQTDERPDIERPDIEEEAPIEQVITDEFVKRFARQAELYQNQYLPLCLKLTNEADWVNHGKPEAPKYSLQCSGAEKVCNPLGIVWERPIVTKHEREDQVGKFYEYEVDGIVQSRVLKRYGWFTGNCSSRDQFFTARGHFDEGDIRKSAFSNWLVNSVTRLAGIRNPTPGMLQRAGLDPEKIGRIDYSGRRSPDQEGAVISEAQGKRLWAIARSKGVSEEQLRAFLKTFGIESVYKVTRKDYDEIVKQIEAGKATGGGNAKQ